MFNLPQSLVVDGIDYLIDFDFRKVLNIFDLFEDNELTTTEKRNIMVNLLFVEKPPNVPLAAEQAAWFIDGGAERHISGQSEEKGRLYSFSQDKIYIFSGVDSKLGYSSRSKNTLHWWLWLGAFMDLGECTFSHITYMRRAKKEGKLSKEEQKQWYASLGLYELKSEYNEAQDLLAFVNS